MRKKTNTAPTSVQSTAAQSTAAQSTAVPSTATPSTAVPSTVAPSTATPSTVAPSTEPPSTPTPVTAPIKPEVYIEYAGNQLNQEKIVELIKKDWEASETKAPINQLEVYIKVEEATAYYVINGTEKGSVQY